MLIYEDLVPNEHFGILFLLKQGLIKQKNIMDICYFIQSFRLCAVANKVMHDLQQLLHLSLNSSSMTRE